jgi:hypothetical protein
MKHTLIILLTAFAIVACKRNSSENETVEYYHNNPKIIFKKIIHKDDFDSVFYFYDNGHLFKEGKQDKNDREFGIWKLYDKDSHLREIREWFITAGKSRINRAWFLNKKGDTLAGRYDNNIFAQKEFKNDTLGFRNSSYNTFKFLTSDTIKVSQYYYAFANCGSPVLRDYNSKVMIIVDNTNTLKDDFSNLKNVKVDTFYYAKIDTIHKTEFPSYDLEKVVAFSGKFKSPGKKTIRGYLDEYTTEYPEDNKKVRVESRTYFEKTIYVKKEKK